MKQILAAAALLAPLLVLQDGPQERPAEAGARVGAAAPAFRLNDQDGEIQEVGGEHAQWTVLAFYPKALTGGWTKEVCSLRDAANALFSSEIRVFGISLDSVALQKQFHEREELNFPLLSDPDGSVAAKYGALVAGKPFASRKSFVIDPRGVLRAIDDQVDVTTHGDDVVALVERLKAE